MCQLENVCTRAGTHSPANGDAMRTEDSIVRTHVHTGSEDQERHTLAGRVNGKDADQKMAGNLGSRV